MIQRALTTAAVVPPATGNWAGRSRSRCPVKVVVPEAAAEDHQYARSTLYFRISALLLYGRDNAARYSARPVGRKEHDRAVLARRCEPDSMQRREPSRRPDEEWV